MLQNGQLENIFVEKYKPIKRVSSIGLVTFEDDQGGADYVGVSSRATGFTFSVYRERNNSGHLELVCKIPEGTLSFYDYGIRNNSEYKYYVFKESQEDNTSSYANESEPVQTCFGNYALYDLIDRKLENNIPIYTVDKQNIWQFSLEMQSGGVTQNINKTVYQTFGKYAKTSKSNNNYDSGSFTCLFGEVRNAKYYEPSDKLEAWKDFIYNGRLKLFKDVKGNVWLIDIISSNVTPNDKISETPNTLTFEWVQVNSSNDKAFVSLD